METVAIVGVGLIGGSFGLALKKAGFAGRIVGVSSQRSTSQALERGAIDEALPLPEAIAAADLVYLAQPIGRILDSIRHLDRLVRPGCLVTDAGSTKGEIVALARQHVLRCQFLGGHPLAGKERRGVAYADPDLFQGRTYVLTPCDASDLDTPAARDFIGWIRRIGGEPAVFNAEEHDRIVAFTSHLPQIASTALASTVGASLESDDEIKVSGPGLADSTRLALSSYDLWRDILATNADSIEEALNAYIGELEHLRENLRTRQAQQEFEAAAAFASRLKR
jgi:prephenate dehydrogenase